jgi:hypothetical protein
MTVDFSTETLKVKGHRMWYVKNWKKIISNHKTLWRKTIIRNWKRNKNLPWQAETKTIYDHWTHTPEDTQRNHANRTWRLTMPWKD